MAQIENINPSSQSSMMEEFSYDDGVVRQFVLATLVWGLVALLAGATLALYARLARLRGDGAASVAKST